MYGLPQAGVLAHAKLKSVLAPHGYTPTKNTPGLWTHLTRPIAFTLVVDDFGVNYVGEEHAKHLLNILLENDEGVHEDWGGTQFLNNPKMGLYPTHLRNLNAGIH